MVLGNACAPLAIATGFGSLTGNSINPVGFLKLIVLRATGLKCPEGKGNSKHDRQTTELNKML